MNKDDALLHLLGAMSMGSSEYIEHQEKQGQWQISAGTRFPLKISGMSKADLYPTPTCRKCGKCDYIQKYGKTELTLIERI